ncbi:hypothetical protein GGR51DRAFT_506682 [Nemania sp. FL0031]|nr:hypothetical protein GGR51DRAFT_506682 [Nemania sp. FL0031]
MLLSGGPRFVLWFFIGHFSVLDIEHPSAGYFINSTSRIKSHRTITTLCSEAYTTSYVCTPTQGYFREEPDKVAGHSRIQVPKQVPRILRRHSPLLFAFLLTNSHHVVFDKKIAHYL